MPEKCRKVPERYEKLTNQENKILFYVKDYGEIETKDVVKILDIKDRRAREILKSMVHKKFLRVQRRGKNTHYVLSK
ncbi:MAG: hypothetical protein FH751_03915 [Firmicutes bacterium]|nr:hypothetical protein [Bacillota bacterium]